MTLKLYGRARSRADRNLWLLFELNAPFEQVEVIQPVYVTSPDQVSSRSASYMKINPNGRVPVLEDDGVVIWESLAINLYLARKFGGPLAPNGLVEEGHTAMWSLWAANECEQLGAQVVVHRVNKPPAEREPAKADAAVAQLRAPFAVLNGALARQVVSCRRPIHRRRHQRRHRPELFEMRAGAFRRRTQCIALVHGAYRTAGL